MIRMSFIRVESLYYLYEEFSLIILRMLCHSAACLPSYVFRKEFNQCISINRSSNIVEFQVFYNNTYGGLFLMSSAFLLSRYVSIDSFEFTSRSIRSSSLSLRMYLENRMIN